MSGQILPARTSVGTRSGPATLPTPLLEVVQSRLSMVALMSAIGFGTVLATDLFFHFVGVHTSPALPGEFIAIHSFFIVVGLGLWLLLKLETFDPHRLVDVGMIFQVVGAFGIAISENQAPWPEQINHWGISWVCFWVAIYPMIVPATPGKAAFTAMVAASMGPLAMMVMTVAGNAAPPAHIAIPKFIPNYLCAGLAVFPALAINKLGSQISEARKMGSYQLESLIGRGGMGEVWRARHGMLARPAAVKLVRPEFVAAGGSEGGSGSRSAMRRFEKEAQATAQLKSPHTVGLYDYGIADDGSAYYVMELLDGVDLETMVKRFGPIPSERVVHLLMQVCDSLEEAHCVGLVHRDIKPANIFACRYGTKRDFAKVLDFGLVKTDRTKDSVTQLTGEGMASGTPAYMAPEQALNERVDARVDLYALGCVAYWLLTGQLVFNSDSSVKMALAHVQSKPEPPSTRTELSVPQALDELVMACLEKNPDARPASAAELRERLAAIAFDRPWTSERASKWWEAHMPEAPTPALTSTPSAPS
jgi:serine/threonine-protein kinase